MNRRSSHFPSWGLTPQLFLFILLPLTLVLILVSFGGLSIHQRAMRDLVGERDVRAVRAAASALLEQLNHRRIAVQALAMSATLHARAVSVGDAQVLAAADLEEVLEQSEFLLRIFDQGLAFFDMNGQLLASRGEAHFWEELASSPELQTLLETSRVGVNFAQEPEETTQIATSQIAALSDPALILFAFTPAGGPAAVGALSPEMLIGRTLNDVVRPSQSSVTFVVDEDGALLYLAGEPVDVEDPASHPGVSQALQGISGATYLPVEGGEHVVAYSPVPLVNWALVVEEPWAMISNPLLDITEQAPLVLIPLVVLSMIALWFATQRIVQPLKDLEARAARLAWGDFAAIEEPVGGINEIQHLQGELVLMAQKLRAAQQGLRNYIGAMTAGQEEERRRLARELHDDTLQALIALKQRVQLAEMAPNGTPSPTGLQEIEVLTDQTIQNLRRVTRALRPIYLEDLGLVPALEMLAKEVEASSSLQVHFQRTGSEKRLSPPVELALYRIAQEALTNSLRHADASQAGVQIIFEEREVELQVWDNGRGFAVPDSPAEFAPGGHYGLLGLYERSEMIGARLAIESSPEKGTRVTVRLVGLEPE